MKFRSLMKFLGAATLLGLLAFVPQAAVAAPIFGTLNITGSVAVGATTIDWYPLGTGVGTFAVEPTSTGTFAPLGGTTGTAKDLDVTVQPVGSPFTLMNFLTFSANPALHFDLMFIDPGVYSAVDCGAPAAPGQTCTPLMPPPKSPFNLANTNAGSTASFVVRGQVSDGTGAASNFVGTYTTQFTGLSYQDLLGTISRGGTVNTSYSANFVVTAIPEPATWTFMMIAGGLIGVSRLRRRRS